MTDEVLTLVADACRAGLSVSAIERKLGISNRNVRAAKSKLYETGILPTPDYSPRKPHASITDQN